MLNDKKLDKTIPIPLYFQLKTIISEEIENGSYPVGGLIPTENELSAMFEISRTTVRQAITELVQEGRLYRIKSKGTFVAQPKINQEFMNCLQSYDDEIRARGRTPSTEVLMLEVVNMPERFAAYLSEPSPKAICLYRKRCADGEPVVRVKTYLPYEPCRFVLEHDFSKEGLYSVLSQNPRTRICRVSRTCEAVAAEKEDVEILNMRRGRPVHYFTTVGYNSDGEPIEYSIAHYRGDQSRFHVDIVLNEK
ncbi:MAG: GntR family transcriptional regulator [Oscillospiraceae bacterium]